MIDYYSSRKHVNAEPDFHLDVRPAMDSFGNAKARAMVAIGKGAKAVKKSIGVPDVILLQARSALNGFCGVVFVSLVLSVLVIPQRFEWSSYGAL